MTTTEIEQATDGNPKLKVKDYKSSLKPVWCPGCGNFSVLNGLAQAFSNLELKPHEIAVMTGIGCSSRLPGYLATYGFNSLHGRALPMAIGVKLANPTTTVVAAGGDGDGFSIGGGHVPHAVRKNVDITYVVMDNRIYGLTKGQMSPTTPLESYTSTTAYGSYDPPVNMIGYMLAYGAGFIARAFAGNIKQLTSLIEMGIQYRGFAFIQVLSPCVTYRGQGEYATIKDASRELPDGYDPTDKKAAWDIAEDQEHLNMGLIYLNKDLIPYDERLDKMRGIAKSKGVKPLDQLIDIFKP
jgi:2-oxoglutarate/2-oxoacid ferredoxin oxidoreductase subunit beta